LFVGVQNALGLYCCGAVTDGIWRGRRELSKLPLNFRECVGIGWRDRNVVDSGAVGDGGSDISVENADIRFILACVVELIVVVRRLRPKARRCSTEQRH
jgi:hypothetical protein